VVHFSDRGAITLDVEPFVSSDADAEFVVEVWFFAPVRIKRICIAYCGAENPESHPSTVRCFAGPTAEGLSFDGLEDAEPAQIMELPMDPTAEATTQCNARPFNQVAFLLLHFTENHSAGELDQTRVSYVGLQGEHTHAKRQAVEAKYELVPNAEDKNEAWKQLGLDKHAQFGAMQ